MTGSESIRDVIAFPKTQSAQCLLTQAPSAVDERQLRDLHIRLRQQVQTTAEVEVPAGSTPKVGNPLPAKGWTELTQGDRRRVPGAFGSTLAQPQ